MTPEIPREINDIVIIGPVSVGKTTVAREVATRLRVPVVSMDDKREGYYREIGYDPDLAKRLSETQGPAAVWCYWHVFDPYSVERLLQEHPGHVIDMGGGSTIHEHDDQLRRVKAALAPYPNVFLLLPCQDPVRSLEFLNTRTGCVHKARNINRTILEHRSNYELARFIVYTEERSPEQIADEILERRIATQQGVAADEGTRLDTDLNPSGRP